VIAFTIPEATPSLNTVLRSHWRANYYLRSRWQWFVRAAIVNNKLKPSHWTRAKVTIERFGPRRLDADNFAGGTKILMDCLVREGFIEDDSPRHIECEYLQHFCPEPKTIVHIEPVEVLEPSKPLAHTQNPLKERTNGSQ
jgi:hypothetical protein